MKQPPSYSQQIDEIMDHFDFAKVHKAMVALDWTWHKTRNDPEDGHIPDEPELRAEARRLLKEVTANHGYEAGCGGLHTFNENGVLRLMYVVDDWSWEP